MTEEGSEPRRLGKAPVLQAVPKAGEPEDCPLPPRDTLMLPGDSSPN